MQTKMEVTARPPSVVIVDYGVGNIGAQLNMLEYLGIDAIASDDSGAIATADRLILPGVGSFDAAVNELRRRDLIAPLEEAVLQRKRPILGVCLGMQLLGHGSEEGRERGLGWIEAEVRRLAIPAGSGLKVPHIGWSDIRPVRASPLLDAQGGVERFYFVHSYHMCCAQCEDLIAVIDYGDEVACIVGRDNIHGVQFHPEKSHRFGMRLLQSFCGA